MSAKGFADQIRRFEADREGGSALVVGDRKEGRRWWNAGSRCKAEIRLSIVCRARDGGDGRGCGSHGPILDTRVGSRHRDAEVDLGGCGCEIGAERAERFGGCLGAQQRSDADHQAEVARQSVESHQGA